MLDSALAERLGGGSARLELRLGAEREDWELPGLDHGRALARILRGFDLSSVAAVGHRVVHGGEAFRSSTRIDLPVLEQIEGLRSLAPLHNPANAIGIREAMQALPSLPHVAVFDTAFHQTMPPEAFLYAVPYGLYERHALRRYGFHGSSHRFVAQGAAERLGRPIGELSLVTAHLGNGCSACAIRKGESVDTTMGLTPLEGLVMGTRSGDVDPNVFTFLAERYERKSVMITSNLVFSQWDKIFKDPMTTAAAIDRLVHHATILELTGESYRGDAAKRRSRAGADATEAT